MEVSLNKLTPGKTTHACQFFRASGNPATFLKPGGAGLASVRIGYSTKYREIFYQIFV
jgi:hypothetical protein